MKIKLVNVRKKIEGSQIVLLRIIVHICIFVLCNICSPNGIMSGFFSKLSVLVDKPVLRNVCSHDSCSGADVSILISSCIDDVVALFFRRNRITNIDEINISIIPKTRPTRAPNNNFVCNVFPVYGKRKSNDGNSSIFMSKRIREKKNLLSMLCTYLQ